MKTITSRFAVCMAVGCGMLACQASVQGQLNLKTQEDTQQVEEFNRPLEEPPIKVEPISSDEFGIEQFALLGARHDLRYTGPTEESCRCLSVALHDQVNHPSFSWEGAAPRLQSTTQWVIALSSSGLSCEGAPDDTVGASYQGYEVQGDNVVVFVEPLAKGRPLTSGAVIPKPLANGSVYVEASGAVYGRPLTGKGQRCRLEANASRSKALSRR